MSKAAFLDWEMESERLQDEALKEYVGARTPEDQKAVVKKLTEELN